MPCECKTNSTQDKNRGGGGGGFDKVQFKRDCLQNPFRSSSNIVECICASIFFHIPSVTLLLNNLNSEQNPILKDHS